MAIRMPAGSAVDTTLASARGAKAALRAKLNGSTSYDAADYAVVQSYAESWQPKPIVLQAEIGGDSGNNSIDGTGLNDVFDVSQGGDDIVNGLGGLDIFYYGAALTAADQNDGGNGEQDALVLQGNYALTLGASSLVNIEIMSLQGGAITRWGQSGLNSYDYSITTLDANVAAATRLLVNAQSLQAGEDFTFNGSAETDGRFLIYAGHGIDTLTGGNSIDIFHFEGGRLNAGDTVVGGGGQDSVVIALGTGLNYVTFGETQFSGIESISVNGRFATDPTQTPSYDLTLANGNVTAGGTLIVNGNSLGANQVFVVHGNQVTGGSLLIFGGAGGDVLEGGALGDTLRGGGSGDVLVGGGGNDVFRYDATSESTGAGRDMIFDFTVGDVIDLSRIDADTTTEGNQDFTSIGTAAFSNVAGQLRYELQFGSQWLVQADTNGDGLADFEVGVITADGDLITNADFLGTVSVDGAVLDGYIANGRVFRDANNNGAWDFGEEFTFTDAQGNFANLGGTGRIVLVPVLDGGGNSLSYDISTGKAFTGVLSAPDGSTVVTPLTTLVDSIAGTGADAGAVAAAQAQVLAALGLDSGVNLASYDPLAIIGAGGTPEQIAQALEVQQASILVANVITVVAGALEAGGVSGAEAAQFASAAIAGQIGGGALNLADSATLTQVVNDAAGSSGASLGGQTGAIADSLAAVNSVIAQVPTDGDPAAALASIVTAQIVAQDQLLQETQEAVGGGAPLDSGSFTGSELTDRLDDAADEVEVILPVSTPPGAPGAPDRPTVDDGVRVSGAEAANGVVVSVAYSDTAGIAAGDTLRLMIGGVQVASYTLTAGDVPGTGATLTHQFAVGAGLLGADGTKILTAQFVRAGGQSGAVSSPLVVTLDTTSDIPSQLVGVEGTIVTALEAANGTSVSGRAEIGSTVTVTFSNGGNTVVKQTVAGPEGFTVNLSAGELAALGEGYISYAATAVDVAGNAAGAPVTSQLFYTTDPIFGDARIDTPSLPAEFDDDQAGLAVTALRGGGHVLAYRVDGDDDGDFEGGIAVQRFNSDGSLAGGPVLLQGIPEEVMEADELMGDFTALEGGGYAFVYGIEPEGTFQNLSAAGNANGTVNMTVVGRPQYIFINSAPPGATFTLQGRNAENTGPATVVLTPVNGVIEITEGMLDVFLYDYRMNLVVGGMTTGTNVNLFLENEATMVVDLDAATFQQSYSITVGAGFNAVGGHGRAESFHIDAATSAGGGVSYQLLIGLQQDPFSIDLTGVPTAQALSTGSITIPGLQPDANGNIIVPPSILAQLGNHDAQIVLIAYGLQTGSTFSATMTSRPLEEAPDGVFAQTFDANGVAVGAPVQIDGLLGSEIDGDDDGTVGVSSLPGGGFVAHWVIDTDNDGEGDGLGVQHFDAAGNTVGAPVTLQGISEYALNAEELVFSLTPLDGGGYALAFGIELEGAFRPINANLVAGQSVFIPVVGLLEEVFVNNVPPGASFFLTGRNATDTGNAFVPLTVVDGVIFIDESAYANFLTPNRIALQVTGPNGGAVGLGLSANVNQAVDIDATPLTQDFTLTATAQGRVTIALNGRMESVDITSAVLTGAAPIGQLVITPVFGADSIDITGIAGAQKLGNGQILISNIAPDANGVITVPAGLLSQLGDDDVAISLNISGLVASSTLTATATYLPYEALPSGIYAQVFGADGVALTDGTTRLDTGFGADIDDDLPSVGVHDLPDGGFMVHWFIDDDEGNGEDSAAFQRFAANGTPIGSVIVLEGVSPELLAADEPALDITVRPDGSVLFAYGLEPEEAFNTLSATGTGGPLNPFSIVGEPSSIYIQTAPAGATFVLSGAGASFGESVQVALTPVNGVIEITEEILSQFGDFGRFGLFVNGVGAGETVTLGVETDITRAVDFDAPLEGFTSSSVVGANGIVAITGPGRLEGFDVSLATPAGGSPSYILLIAPTYGPMSVDLSGIPGIFVQSNGTFVVSGLTPDANGYLAVPQIVLDRLGEQDANIFLVIQNVQPGFASTATAYGRPTVAVPDGLFVQAFDADGNAIATGLNLIGTAGNDILVGDLSGDFLLSNGGSDVMTGGAGADQFSFLGALGNSLITDFNTGVDLINVSGLDADIITVDDQAFSFIGSAAFSGTAGELRAAFDAANGVWRIEGDTDGANGADFVIQVTGALADPLTAADFVL